MERSFFVSVYYFSRFIIYTADYVNLFGKMKMEINKIKEIAQNLDKENIVSIYELLKERKYFAALRRCFGFVWQLYKKYIKGKFITVKGKKIPLTAIIVALFGLYIIFPSSEEKTAADTPENDGFIEQTQESIEHQANTYDKDGLKIYNFEKCGQGICGLMENSSDKTFSRVIISVTFDDRQRNVLAEGNIDAQNIKPMTRTKLKITSDVEFYSFTLTDVTVE